MATFKRKEATKIQKTSIEWVVNPDGSQGFTWNPVTGCKRGCVYCYAQRIAKRFGKTEAERNFEPVFHEERLIEPSDRIRPATIFTGSMADLFGPWAPVNWILSVLNFVAVTPRHTFLFLTKYPERYRDFNPWPSNCWLGATATNGTTWWAGQSQLARAEWEDGKRRSFISLEPLLGNLDIMARPDVLPPVDWLIVGGQTGPGAKPSNSLWTLQAFAYAQKHGIPAFGKDNLWVNRRPRDLPYLEKP